VKLKLRPVGATSSIETIAFSRKNRRRGTELRPHHALTFPPPALKAVAFQALRNELQLDEREAARALGLRVAELQDVERGRAIPEERDGWALAADAIRAAAAERDERAARSAW
jgi:DNA-binding transcriptional regulator YiaG